MSFNLLIWKFDVSYKFSQVEKVLMWDATTYKDAIAIVAKMQLFSLIVACTVLFIILSSKQQH